MTKTYGTEPEKLHILKNGMNLQLFAEGDPDPNGGEPEKKYTEADLKAHLDKAVGERLARESIYDMKEIIASLNELGYEGTPAEIKQAVKQQAEEWKKEQDLKTIQAQAQATGTSPELMAEIRALKAEIQEIKNAPQKAEEEKRKQQEAYNAQVDAFEKKYPDIDVEKLLTNQKFAKFVTRSSPKLTLVDVYEDFQELVGATEAEAIAKINANLARSTASGKEKGDPSGGTYGLTAKQQELAKEGGMSFKEYAEIQKLIKK